MIGDRELRSLAHLLEISSETARAIAATRPCDGKEINRLADLTDEVAAKLAALVNDKEDLHATH